MRNPNQRSAHYRRQSPFAGSHRQIRGMVLKAFTKHRRICEKTLVHKINAPPETIKKAIEELVREGFLSEQRGLLKMAL